MPPFPTLTPLFAIIGGMYLATTAVVMQEVMKLFVCLFILWRERGFDVPATLQFLKVCLAAVVTALAAFANGSGCTVICTKAR
jgi:hypothetical protein